MLILIAALIATGAVLAVFGTAGFCLVATTSPTAADLTHARRVATAGRWCVAVGVLLLWTSPAHVAGITGILVTLAICTGCLTLITKSPITRLAAA